MVAPVAYAQSNCPVGELWEPYTQVCAEVRDFRGDYPLRKVTVAGKPDTELPVPGSMAVGTAYSPNQLVALDSGRLHTKMFVYPNGVSPNGPLPLFYTTATSRVNRGLELLVAYSDARPDISRLNLYAWPCLPNYPCPDGETDPGWQWSRNLTELTCNITQIVDQGGHAQKQLYYANHTDRLDDGSPPQWKSAIYLWNYCDAAWDLAWQHTYRQDKVDCSIPGAGCAWWGPSLEIFGSDPYPQIAELGYEDSLLYHDGVWSELRPDEAGFRDPARWATTTPWQLFHLDPNRSYGVGNYLNENAAPVIEGQLPLETQEDEPMDIDTDSLVISDPDVDPAYHVAYALTLYDGDNYTKDDGIVTPVPDYAGPLTVPITVSDGAANSVTFELSIDVTPVNDAPVISGQAAVTTLERTPIEITLQHVVVEDPDNDTSELQLSVHDSNGFDRNGNVIVPLPGVIGALAVPVTVSDGQADSTVFNLAVTVNADTVPPVITMLGEANVSLVEGSAYTDAGATASDNVDGDLTVQIVTLGIVNTMVPGTYTVTYTVSDQAGNAAAPQERIVIVLAMPAPPVRGDGDGGACFIATAAYGSYLDLHVEVLRTFRDQRLMTNRPGREFVSFYYDHSPPIARVISEHPLLKAVVRGLLTPIVYGLAYPKTAMALLITIFFLTLRLWRTVRRRMASLPTIQSPSPVASI